MNVEERKLETLQAIYKAFEDYNGKHKSELEKQIEKVKAKLSEQELLRLQEALKNYRDYILTIMANSKKVFVKLHKIKKSDIPEFEDLDLDDILPLE